MPKGQETPAEELVPLNALIPRGIKTWIKELAFAASSPDEKVSMAEMARRLLEEAYKEYLQKQNS